MTPSQLKYELDNLGSTFFNSSNMKFSGDTMKNYGVRKVEIISNQGNKHFCWELYRRRPVTGVLGTSLTDSAYFDCTTFSRIFPSRNRSGENSSIRFVMVKNKKYLLAEDVSAYLLKIAATEETDTKERLNKAAEELSK